MVMVTKKIIKSEIERVPEERLEELYEVVKSYSQPEKGCGGDMQSKAVGLQGLGDHDRASQKIHGNTLFSRLRNIRIDGPEDFSENLDLYLSGEKTIG